MLDKYNAHESEKKWQKYWEDDGIYKFDPSSDKEIYSIDTPPPTMSGKMHMGHAFSYIQMDIIARYQRMKGKNVFYPFGTDDNGLPTERLVESLKKVKAKNMDRKEFINLCQETVNEQREQFVQGWKNVGISCDWNLFYSTIGDHCRRISQRSFLELYNMGRIYRKKGPIIFCPNCKTAIAQVEMRDEEKKSTLNYIKANIGRRDSNEFIIYATTRPELHPACVGVSIDEKGEYVTALKHDEKQENNENTPEENNPEKWIMSKEGFEKFKEEFNLKLLKTYKGKELVGREVHIKFAQAPVKITHDISAKTEYGTGVVYYCSYGGLDCVEWMARHLDVLPVHIMDESGVYNELSPYKGLNSEQARKQVLEDLHSKGLLIKKQNINHVVNVHERCNFDIEYIATEQWYIKYLDLKEQFLENGSELKWHPEHMKNRYDNWVKGLQWDWCISRQRHFGVPFPIWYSKKTGEAILADYDQLPVDPLVDIPKTLPKNHTASDIIPEKDVLDTWATSTLTPIIAIELLKDHENYEELRGRLFPMSLRAQAHDIISFWLFNTLVKSQLHEGKNPWKNVMISGWALDKHGKKMSKSKGNVVEPEEMISKFSADPLRFWTAGSRLGDDLWFADKEFVTGQRLVVKLWNASKLCLSHLQSYKFRKLQRLEIVDRWMLSKLNKLVLDVTNALDNYEYSKLRNETNNLFWNVFCDYYLEIVKDRLYNPERRGVHEQESAQYTVYICLKTFLKLFAPIIPHITEEIYQEYFAKQERDKLNQSYKSIHLSSWPSYDPLMIDEDAEKSIDRFTEILQVVRKAKTENGKPLNAPVKKLTIKCVESDNLLRDALEDIKSSTKSEQVVFGEASEGICVECEGFVVGIEF